MTWGVGEEDGKRRKRHGGGESMDWSTPTSEENGQNTYPVDVCGSCHYLKTAQE